MNNIGICDHCGRLRNDVAFFDNVEMDLCDTCFEDYYTICKGCGDIVSNDSISNRLKCNKCREETYKISKELHKEVIKFIESVNWRQVK